MIYVTEIMECTYTKRSARLLTSQQSLLQRRSVSSRLIDRRARELDHFSLYTLHLASRLFPHTLDSDDASRFAGTPRREAQAAISNFIKRKRKKKRPISHGRAAFLLFSAGSPGGRCRRGEESRDRATIISRVKIPTLRTRKRDNTHPRCSPTSFSLLLWPPPSRPAGHYPRNNNEGW